MKQNRYDFSLIVIMGGLTLFWFAMMALGSWKLGELLRTIWP